MILASVFGFEDVARIAIEQFEGAMNYLKIYALDETPNDVSQNSIKDMIRKIVEIGEIEYNSDLYVVEQYGKGHKLVQISVSANQHRAISADSNADSFTDIPTQNERLQEMEATQ